MMPMKTLFDKYGGLISEAVLNGLPGNICLQKNVVDAMHYAVTGGKHVRAHLSLAFCELFGGDPRDALPAACAVEYIHSYSLIHDDLPCMDDDDMRRGKPSTHIVFGEDIALLAGDALQSLAFETLLKNCRNPETAQKSALLLAEAAGFGGMVGGQVIDLEYENSAASLELLEKMHSLKTGALIRASTMLGAYSADAGANDICAASDFSKKIGLVFQVIDDILDVEGDEAELGKPVNSDAGNQKSTYVTLLGIEKARKTAAGLTDEAKQLLAPYGEKGVCLSEFADWLLNRKH